MSKPVVAQLEDGSEWGFEDAATALRNHPTATILRYQDGTAIEDAPATTPGERRLSKQTRAQLDTVATSLGLDPAAHRTKASLLAAIRAVQASETASVEVANPPAPAPEETPAPEEAG